MPDIVLTRLLSEAAHRHVLDHAGAQRADGPGGKIGRHRGFLSRAEGCWTFDARDRMPRSSPPAVQPLNAIAKNVRTAMRGVPRERVRSLPHIGPSRRWLRTAQSGGFGLFGFAQP